MNEIKTECLHNWEYGYVADLVIYCTKCKKEADEVYDKSQFCYSTHELKNNSIVKILKNEDILCEANKPLQHKTGR